MQQLNANAVNRRPRRRCGRAENHKASNCETWFRCFGTMKYTVFNLLFNFLLFSFPYRSWSQTSLLLNHCNKLLLFLIATNADSPAKRNYYGNLPFS